jgi:hypothetical protein
MFLRTGDLNEGRVEGTLTEDRKLGHVEGKNPRTSTLNTKLTGWESSKTKAYVNSNWEKLRK